MDAPDPYAEFADAPPAQADPYASFADAPPSAPTPAVPVPAYKRTPGYSAAAADAAQALHNAPLNGDARGLISQAVQGSDFGLTDEAGGALAALKTGGQNFLAGLGVGKPAGYGMSDAYHATVDADRGMMGAYQQAHPGLSLAANVVGGALTPGLGLAGDFVKGAGSFAGSVARSAGAGGLIAAAQGAGNATGGFIDRGKAALESGAVGTALGAAAPALITAARAVPGLISGATGATEDAVASAANEALSKLGLGASDLSADGQAALAQRIKSGQNASQAAMAVVAQDDLPVSVPLTKGDITSDPAQQLKDNTMLRGAKGRPASLIMQAARANQQTALDDNIDAISDQLAGGSAPARNSAGAGISSSLNSMRDEAQAGVNANYQNARQVSEGANLPRDSLAGLGADLREAVNDYVPASIPHVNSVLDSVDTLANAGPPTVRDLFDARSRLTSLRGAASTDPVQAGAAGKAVKAIDDFTDEALKNDLFSGDPNAVQAWKDAIVSRRDMGKVFDSGDLIDALTTKNGYGGDTSALKVDPNDATNYILGRSDMGFVGKQNLARDMNKLRDTLGPDSADWNALRSEVFQRVANQGQGAQEGATRNFSGAKFNKSWTQFEAKDPQLVSSLFSDDERGLIRRFASTAAQVTTPVRGGDNPSNSGVTAAALMGGVVGKLKMIPGISHVASGIEDAINGVDANAAVNVSPQMGGNPPPTGIVPPVAPIGRAARATTPTIAAGTAGIRTSAPAPPQRTRIGQDLSGVVYYSDGTADYSHQHRRASR